MTNKEQILDIIGQGEKATEKLSEKGLKEMVLDHFKKLALLINGDNHREIEELAKKLTFGVLDALNFQDTDILQQAEVEVREWIEEVSE